VVIERLFGGGDGQGNPSKGQHMSDGMFDDVPLMNKARDKAWEAFTKRKNAATLFTDDKDFEFPLNGGFYAMWCVCWAKAWDAGFKSGYEAKEKE
jgi:hypothetical protein